MSAKVQVDLEANVQKFGAAFQAAGNWVRGLLSLGALTAAAKGAIDLGSAINDAAAKAQVGTQWLQEVSYAATQAGGSMESVTTAIAALRQSIGQALGGSRGDLDAFRELGISLADLRTGSPDQIFDRVAAAVRKSNGSMASMNAAVAVLGRGSRDLMPILVDGLDEARQRAQELGIVLDEDVIEGMDELGDALADVTMRWKSMTAQILYNMTNLNNWFHLAKLIVVWNASIKKLAWDVGTGNAVEFGTTLAVTKAKVDSVIDSYVAAENDAADERRERRERRERQRSSMANTAFTRSGGGGVKVEASDALARIGGYLLAGPGGSGMGSLIRTQTSALAELRRIQAHVAAVASERRRGHFISW